MGFQIILDFLGATMLGGAFLLNLLHFQGDDFQRKQESRDDIVAQQNLTALVSLLEEDFHRIGYCALHENMTAPVVIAAGPDYISFKTDLVTDAAPEGDGTIDSVAYMLGGLLHSAANPRERMLYRVENGGQWEGSSLGVTYLDFKYHKYNGDTLARPVSSAQLKEIAGIEVTVRVENQYPFVLPETADSLGIIKVNWKQLDFEIKNFGRGAP
jgi:hypothetical protein